MSNNIPTLDLRVLENRITIAILTLLDREAHELLLDSVIAIHLMDNILDLNTLSSDVLDS